jgi:hypothetical protein
MCATPSLVFFLSVSSVYHPIQKAHIHNQYHSRYPLLTPHNKKNTKKTTTHINTTTININIPLPFLEKRIAPDTSSSENHPPHGLSDKRQPVSLLSPLSVAPLEFPDK